MVEDRWTKRASLTLCMMVLSVIGCSGGSEPAAPEGSLLVVRTSDALAAALRELGAVVEDGGPTIDSRFSVAGRALLVDDVRVEVYRFPDEVAASAEVGRVSGSAVHWVAPARLYRTGPLLAFTAGTGADLLALLERVLGAPVATAS